MASSGFWDNPERSQTWVVELKSLRAIIKPLDEALPAGEDLIAMVEMAGEDASFRGRGACRGRAGRKTGRRA